MNENKCSSCGGSKCSCKNKEFTKAVIEIDNPGCVTLMRKVTIPASMGDDTTVPPAVGKYRNVLLFYEANSKSYLYSSDGIPTQLVNGFTNYEEAINLPQINGHTLLGDKSATDLGIQDKLTAGANISIDANNVISAVDTTYGPATDTEIGLVKPGAGLEVASDGTLSVDDIAFMFDTVADMKAADLANGDYARTLGYYAKDDMGGAYYKISSTTPSGYYETLTSGLYAELIIEDTMNVKQFGAKGDGVADDTASIQTAIDYSISKGIHLNCVGKFLITNSINVPNGIVYLDGFPNGAYGNSSLFIVKNDSGNVIPAFIFSNAMSGSIVKNISIDRYSSDYNQLFDGIVIDRSEHCYFSDVYIKHARNGIYFRCNNGSVYCTSFEHCSAQYCDIGIDIPATAGWNGAVSFRDCYEISDNRIGFNIEETNSLTIAGGATEIGRNTDTGIKISGGSVNLCEGLYIESNTNSDITVSGGVCYINGSISLTRQPQITSNGMIYQDATLINQNIPAPKKFSKNDLALYLSFDNFGSSTVTDYANNITLDNSSFEPVKEGVYGDSSFIKDEFGKGVIKDYWDATGDWTILMCLKDYSSDETLQNMFIKLLVSGTEYYQILLTSHATNRNSVRIVGTNISGFTNFNLSTTDFKKYDWLVLKYDSTNKRISSYYRSGRAVATNTSGAVDFSNVTDVYFRMDTPMKLKADEIIVYNRMLDYDEIQTITDLPYRPTNLA